MIKVTTRIPHDEIRQAFMENRLELDSSAAPERVQRELARFLADLEKEALKNRRKESDHGAELRMQNSKTGQRRATYQRLHVQQRFKPHSS